MNSFSKNDPWSFEITVKKWPELCREYLEENYPETVDAIYDEMHKTQKSHTRALYDMEAQKQAAQARDAARRYLESGQVHS